jgi:hypothetical protein
MNARATLLNDRTVNESGDGIAVYIFWASLYIFYLLLSFWNKLLGNDYLIFLILSGSVPMMTIFVKHRWYVHEGFSMF